MTNDKQQPPPPPQTPGTLPPIEQAYIKELQVTNLDPSIDSNLSNDPAKASTSSVEERTVTKPQPDFKPSDEFRREIAIKYELCLPQLRTPFRKVNTRIISSYVPTTFNYYTVIHYMDQMIQSDSYFTRERLPWHPFISRLYYAIIFYIQTLRAMNYARQIQRTDAEFLKHFEDSYPFDSLPIPGPLAPILKALCASEPSDGIFNITCPKIPKDIGPAQASDVLSLNHSTLALPNVPFLLGMIDTLIHPPDGELPDYTDPNTFNDQHQITINGHDFLPDDWQFIERSILIQPGMTYTPETDPFIDEEFHAQGETLGLPIPDEQDDLTDIEDFLYLTNLDWFSEVRNIMSSYTLKFKDSCTLASCSPFGPPCGLITNRMTTLTSPNANENIINTLTHAFPDQYPVKLWYNHESYEQVIPQLHTLTAQYAGINASIHHARLLDWNMINLNGIDRIGPYWDQTPTMLSQPLDKGFDEIESIIYDHFFIN